MIKPDQHPCKRCARGHQEKIASDCVHNCPARCEWARIMTLPLEAQAGVAVPDPPDFPAARQERPRAYTNWTEDEIMTVYRMRDTISRKALSQLIGRSSGAIESRMRRLEQEVEKLRESECSKDSPLAS